MKQILLILLLSVLAFSTSGCTYAKLVGVLASETSHEKQIPAEYYLKDNVTAGVLVYTEIARSSGAHDRLEMDLGIVLGAHLAENVKIDPESVFISNGVSENLIDLDAERLSPVEAGRKAGVDKVLYVFVERYDILRMGDQGHYSGLMRSRAAIFDVETGKTVWPKEKYGKPINVKVSTGQGDPEAISKRMAVATGHCVTRLLYGCVKAKYRIMDEVDPRLIEEFK